jgi:hypothetical protein
MARAPAEHRDERDPDEDPGGWRGLRNTLLAVAIGTALFLGSWFVLDLQPLSRQERSELFQFTVAVPALLDLCAERAAADQADFRRASLRTAALFREALDRSAAGLIDVPSGSTMSAELDRLTADALEQARSEIGAAQGEPQWRALCTGLLAEFRTAEGAWARLEQKYGRQLRKLDLSRPASAPR